MMAELVGFLSGLAAVSAAGLVFVRYERGRSIAAAYGLPAGRRRAEMP